MHFMFSHNEIDISIIHDYIETERQSCECAAAGTQWELVRLSVECASPCGRPSFLATIWPENDQIHGFGQRKQNKQSEAKIGHMTIDLCPGRQLHKNREQTDPFLFKGKE